MASSACFLLHHVPSTPAATSRTSSHRLVPTIKPSQLICRAQKSSGTDEDSSTAVSRRLALTILIGSVAIGTKISPANAAYGEAANVFGKAKTNTDFLPYTGNGFNLLIPAKWNPSKEIEFPGQVLRYEDNFDVTSNVTVTVTPTSKKTITDYGSPEEFLSSVDYLLANITIPIVAADGHVAPLSATKYFPSLAEPLIRDLLSRATSDRNPSTPPLHHPALRSKFYSSVLTDLFIPTYRRWIFQEPLQFKFQRELTEN